MTDEVKGSTDLQVQFGNRTPWIDLTEHICVPNGFDPRSECLKFRHKPTFKPGLFRDSTGNTKTIHWCDSQPAGNWVRVKVVWWKEDET